MDEEEMCLFQNQLRLHLLNSYDVSRTVLGAFLYVDPLVT
jgi:hypothetical protein